MRDVVSADGLEGAARLHTPVMAAGRISGSALAALLLAWSVPWACFALNAAVSAVAALLVLGVAPSAGASSRWRASGASGEGGGQLLGHLRRTPAVTVPLVLLLCFALFGWNVDVLIPVLVDNQLNAGPEAFGMLVSAMSFGILCGSLTTAVRGRSGPGPLSALLVAFGMTLVPLAAVNHLHAGLAAFWLIGACGGGFLSIANSSVQTAVDPRMQGRVAALYGVIIVGSRTVGGPILGWMIDTFGSRAALASVGAATMCFAGLRSSGSPDTRRDDAAGSPQTEDEARSTPLQPDWSVAWRPTPLTWLSGNAVS